MSDFKIIGSNIQNQKFKRKISESLLIRKKRSSLNTQEMSIPLKLYITPSGNYLLKVEVRQNRVSSIFATLGSLTPYLSKSLAMGAESIRILLFLLFILSLYIKLP